MISLRVGVPLILLLAAVQSPLIALADQEPQAEAGVASSPIVQVAPYQPFWREAPVSTSPEPSSGAVLSAAAVRGTAVDTQGDSLVLDPGNGSLQVVSLPAGPLQAEDVPYGSRVEAVGMLQGSDGSLRSLQVTIYPAS